MGRVINPNNNSKDRTQLSRSIVLALRELATQTKVNEGTRDLVSYISLALDAIMKTIDSSVVAWEKRGYWLKADRFRMEWIWTEKKSAWLREAVMNDDWQTVALIVAQIAEKLQNVKVPQRHHIGTPWIGAWKRLLESESTASPTTSLSSREH